MKWVVSIPPAAVYTVYMVRVQIKNHRGSYFQESPDLNNNNIIIIIITSWIIAWIMV